ncbi:MAG: DUF349 domain-containing protein [Flavobacterium sp.]
MLESMNDNLQPAEGQQPEISTTETNLEMPISENVNQDVIESIDATNAEESEDTSIKEKHDIPMMDYSTLTMDALVGELEKLHLADKVLSVKDHVEEIKKEFLSKFHHFMEEKREEFEAENQDPTETFSYHFPLKNTFDELYKTYKNRLNQHYKSLQKTLQDNLEKREAIVEELRNLINPQESIKDIVKHFNELREQWRALGPIPRDKYNIVWNNYHFHVENFYDFLHLDREARDLEFKHNLEQKQRIIDRVKELINEADIIKAFRELQDLHRIWKEDIGPVSRDVREAIWQEFSELTKKMHDRREELLLAQKAVEQQNADKKKEIIEQIQALVAQPGDSHGKWQKLMQHMEHLRNEFFAVGKAPSEVNEDLWAAFKNAVRDFNVAKNNYYKGLKNEQQSNYQIKLDLLQKANELKDSDDFAATTPLMKQIQEDWKKVGHVPRRLSDKIWEDFKAACNHYFDRLKETRKESLSEELDAFEKKKAYLETLKAFEMTGDHKTDLDAIKKHIEHWKTLGKVPFSRRHIEGKFNRILDALFQKLSLSKKDSDIVRFTNKMEQLASGDDHRKLIQEKIFIQRKIEELQSDIIQFENNMQFFSNAKKDNPLMKEAHKNLAKHKEDLKDWKAKLKQIQTIEKGE